MLTSKHLLAKAGISRATLNNYIALGILPRPVVKRAAPGNGRALRLGYFPHSVLGVIEKVNSLKQEGFTMAEIVKVLKKEPQRVTPEPAPEPAPAAEDEGGGSQAVDALLETNQHSGGELRLTLDQIDYPAYLVNSRFEVEWCNQEAETQILGRPGGLPRDIIERNVFQMLLNGPAMREAEGWNEILRFHLALAKNRLSKTALLSLETQLGSDAIERLLHLYDEVDPIGMGGIIHTQLNLGSRGTAEQWRNLYAAFFREGILFAYVAADEDSNVLLALLARRDLLIQDLLRKRRPFLTPLAVLVADIQDSVKICAELPPEEYFELINHIWGAMQSKLRRYYATHGKHAGDGMVYYFFPQPDCNYVLNAIRCAHEMQETMRKISREWQSRKNWINELQLNIGLDEGQEWFGTYETPTHLEFTVLGDTVNRTARLSKFARAGSVWVSKNMLSKLTTAEREKVRFGIRRKSEAGPEILVSSTYSRISNLIDLNNAKYEKFRDVGILPVTELLDVTIEDQEMERT